MKEVESNTNSLVKRLAGQNIWRIHPAPSTLLKRSQDREDKYYADHSEKYHYRDGLTVPYYVDYQNQKIPLPLAVALEKNDEVRRYYGETHSLQLSTEVWSNDSVFATGDKHGELLMAINKTDPKRNDGDVNRLTSFFHSAAESGFYLYSVGYNVLTDLQTDIWQITSATLRLGRLQQLSRKKIQEILRVHLPKTGTFDSSFILAEGIVERPESFYAVETVVENIEEKYKEYVVGTRMIKFSEASFKDLQLLAHGFHLPEEY